MAKPGEAKKPLRVWNKPFKPQKRKYHTGRIAKVHARAVGSCQRVPAQHFPPQTAIIRG